MTMVGADIAGLRMAATVIDRQAQRIEGMVKAVQTALGRATAWGGRDAEQFRADWNGKTRLQLNQAAAMLKSAGQELRKQADEQEEASAASGSVARPALLRASTENKEAALREKDGFVLSWAKEMMWKSLPLKEKTALFQHMADEYCSRYGIEPVTVKFVYIDGEGNYAGMWSPLTNNITFDPIDATSSWEAINTLHHELRHAHQREIYLDYRGVGHPDGDPYSIKPSWYGGPGEPPIFTMKEIEELAHNYVYYIPYDPNNPDANINQPIEADAYKFGDDSANNYRFKDLLIDYLEYKQSQEQ